MQVVVTSVVGSDWLNGFRIYLGDDAAFPKRVGLVLGGEGCNR